MTEQTGLRRLVLALPPTAASEESLRSALAIAASLQLELLALLIEDERAFGAVGYGFGDEYSANFATPRTKDLPDLETEFGLWARRLERRIAAAAAGARLAFAVERVRGGVAARLTERLGREDVLAVLEPTGALDRAFGAQSALSACAEGICAALTVPARPFGETGAIVVLDAGGPRDAAELLARAIAAATGARVEIWSNRNSGLAEDVPFAALGDELALRRRLRDSVRLLVAPADGAMTPQAAGVLAMAARTGTPVLRLDAGDAPGRKPAASGGGKSVRQSRARGPAR